MKQPLPDNNKTNQLPFFSSLFGTDGIRARVGSFPFTFDYLPLLGRAIGQWIVQKYGTQASVLIGSDTRISCSFIKSSLQTGMLCYPISIHDAGVLPTPGIYLLTQKKNFDCGIVISASHNPFYDNGIKIIDHTFGKLSDQDEQTIAQLFQEHVINKQQLISYDSLGNSSFLPNAPHAYIQYILEYFKPQFLHDLKIVIDCANGALSDIAPTILTNLGAHVITMHATPNGANINHQCGALHLEPLQKAVIHHNAHMGFAFDGDGDRVIAVNCHGEIKNGDDILALLLSHPAYTLTKTVVGTEMSNHGLALHVQSFNKKLVRTRVGDKYVAQALEKENGLLGGEQSGHIILRDYLSMGDGLFTALRLMEALMHTNNMAMVTFTKFPQIHINVPVHQKKDLSVEPIATLIANSNAALKSGRLIVRYSGTENLLRIMIEDEEFNHAHHIGTNLAHALEKELQIIS